MNNRRKFLKKSIILGAFSIFAPKILTNCFPVRQIGLSEVEVCQKAFAVYIGPVIKNILSNTDSGRWANCCKWDETNDSGLIIPLIPFNISSGGYDRKNCIIL